VRSSMNVTEQEHVFCTTHHALSSPRRQQILVLYTSSEFNRISHISKLSKGDSPRQYYGAFDFHHQQQQVLANVVNHMEKYNKSFLAKNGFQVREKKIHDGGAIACCFTGKPCLGIPLDHNGSCQRFHLLFLRAVRSSQYP